MYGKKQERLCLYVQWAGKRHVLLSRHSGQTHFWSSLLPSPPPAPHPALRARVLGGGKEAPSNTMSCSMPPTPLHDDCWLWVGFIR